MFTTILEKVERLERENAELKSRLDKLGSDEGTVSRLSKPLEDEPAVVAPQLFMFKPALEKPLEDERQSNAKLRLSESVKLTITEVENTSPRRKVEPVIPLDKGGMYWYQKNETDIPEYVKILEIHKDGNDYYYTIRVIGDWTNNGLIKYVEKQTIGQYLFNWKTPPLYSLLPTDNRERMLRAFRYGTVRGEINAKPKEDTRLEWRFEDVVPKNEEDRKRLTCVYNHAWKEAKPKEDTRLEWRFEDVVPKNEEDRKRLTCVYNHAWKEAKSKEDTRLEWKDDFLDIYRSLISRNNV